MTGDLVATTRDAVPGDLDAMLAIERSSFPRPWSAASFAEELDRDDRVWLVVDAGGEVAGFAGAADLAGDAHVLSVAVAADRRRRGFASLLVRAVLAAARERFGTTRATLEVRESDLGARALYRRLGFVEAGVRPGYYQDDGAAAVVLWCDRPVDTRSRPHPPQQGPQQPRPLQQTGQEGTA